MNTANSITNKEEKMALIELHNKPFSELTDSQKIDRLVDELRAQRYLIDRVNHLENRMRVLEKHEHGQDGKVLVPVDPHGGLGAVAGLASRRDPLA